MNESMIAALAALIVSVVPCGAQDIEAGKTVFKKCTACHTADRTTNKIGPHLGDVAGRMAGSVEDFNYSNAMKAAGDGGLVWDDANLTEYLASPKTKVPGTKMAFAGIKKDDELADVIAYLNSLKD